MVAVRGKVRVDSSGVGADRRQEAAAAVVYTKR
jgi:hypothetical protein